MALPIFVVLHIYPILFMPYEFFKAVLKRLVLLRSASEIDQDQAAMMDDFQKAYNERTLVRKDTLIRGTLTRSRDELGRTIRALEIGSGSGANFAYYPPGTSVVCLDPNPKFGSYLRTNAEKFPGVTVEEFHVGFAENMKVVADNSIDVVISTLVLCTVKDVEQCLREIKRVLRPGGKFVFLEHVAAGSCSSPTYFLQHLFKRVYYYVFFDCCITRHTGDIIRRAGFSQVQLDYFVASELAKPSPILRPIGLISPHVSGVAIK